jgi:tetratricopeptide (TPR) repeat protein
MRKDHLTDERLIQLLDDLPPDPVDEERTRAEQHLFGCRACTTRFNEYREFAMLLREADVWHLHELNERPQRDWVRRVSAIRRQLRDEESEADALVKEHITGPAAWWRARLAKTGRSHTYSMVRRLLRRADAYIYTVPSDSLVLTAIAVEIADELRVDAYPFDLVVTLRAQAAREHAFALFYAGRFPEALQAIDRSEQLYRQMTVHEFDIARTSLVRALIYRSIDRVPEAIPLSRAAGDTFLNYGERERYVKARMTEAAMLFHVGRVAEALAVWQPLENEPTLEGTPDFGMLLHNLGSCFRQLDDLERARDYYTRAIAEYELRDMQSEIVRTRWALGLTLVAAGQLRDALPVLRRTWNEFDALTMESDAALVGLEVAELLIIIEQPSEVPTICRNLLDRFTRNGMTSRAVTALAFLREAVALGNATPALIRHVHDFLRDLPQHPSRSFIPPPK